MLGSSDFSPSVLHPAFLLTLASPHCLTPACVCDEKSKRTQEWKGSNSKSGTPCAYRNADELSWAVSLTKVHRSDTADADRPKRFSKSDGVDLGGPPPAEGDKRACIR